jgi:TRAP transporter 4TM/12TM fusion protein
MGPDEEVITKIAIPDEEVITKIAKIEAPTRELTGIAVKVVWVIGICFSLYQLYALQVSPQDPWILRSVHFAFASVLGFLLYPSTSRSPRNRIQVIDIVLLLTSLGVLTYTLHQFEFLAWRLTMVPITTDVITSTVLIILVLELTRRCVGLPLVILCAFFLFYSWGGQFFPSFLWHRGYPWSRTAGYLFSYEGINGMTLGVSSTFVFMFILFGAFLQVSGTGEFLVRISYSIAGRFRGGPAKVAVVASSLMGTISGSAVGNTVTTGSMTIPLMMRVGYKPWFAGAVEAVASTGGQIMPPIMGAGAFLMAEIIGQPYVDILVAAIIPALLYYTALFWMVDIEAVKLGLGGLPADQLPNFKEVLLRGWLFLVPIAVLIWSLVVARHSPVRAATFSMLTSIVVSWFIPEARMGLVKILDGLERGARNVVSVAAVCAAAGIIVGVLGITGMGVKIAGVLVDAAGGNLFIALLISMLVCLLLGMGLPTTPAYAVVASVVAPGLIKMGLDALTAHLFCFFFACIGPVTPPVAVASYAGAAIAQTSPTKVGWVGLRLALVGFIVPFAFVYGPSLLMRGGFPTILFTFFTAVVGILAIGMALQGMVFQRKTNFVSRGFFFASALLLIKPGIYTDIFGFTALVAGFALHFMVRKILGKKADRPAIA